MSAAEQMKDQLGPALCLAKWKQVSLHLPTGLNNSCYHPPLHPIDPVEIKFHPGALHNTAHKKAQRQLMLSGQRPAECSYCWNMEDQGKLSDRHYRSGEPWAAVDFETIKNSTGLEEHVIPSYVEVNFNNACNLKCSYCSPQFSSSWGDEVHRYGAYPTATPHNAPEHFSGTRRVIPAREHNPYVEAFWKWWPSLYRDLHTFRITGGEPLLSKDTFKILDYIIETDTPNKKLSLCINSNLGVPEKLFNEFVSKIEKILDKELVHEFIIFTSCDTHGEQANYIRHGFDYKLFHERVDFLLDKFKTITIDIMSTYNALSVPGYKKLIEDVIILKERHHNPYRYWGSSLLLDSSYLRWPNHQTVKILDKSWVKEIDEQAKLVDFHEQMRTGLDGYGFTDIEINKIKRIKDWLIAEEDEESINKNRKDFYKFIREHDKRRNTDFIKTFPELEEFLAKCRVS